MVEQGELFSMAEVGRPRSCRNCTKFFEDPYPRCELQPGVALIRFRPCKHFVDVRDFNYLREHNEKIKEPAYSEHFQPG
jgi:hypothetical protein